jgi:F420-non-reducing hydrogenase large subunit
MKRIRIDPITRLEGHGKIEIFLDEHGNVANAYFQTPELRGFEQFCVGRRAEDLPAITSRICGVCPEAHHIASVKALDRVFDAPPPRAAEKIRELLYMAFFVTDHTTHFYALGGPDFIVGPDAPPAERNLLGVVRKVGPEIARSVIDCRARNHKVIEMLGGRGIHPVAGLPGGWSKSVSPEEREEIERVARENIAFAQFSLGVFDGLVWSNPADR